MTPAEIFRPLIYALEKSEIQYMLTGSFASNVYGMGRATMAVDLVISATAEQIRALSTFLSRPNYEFDLEAARQALQHRSMFNVFDLVRGWKIDFIFQKPHPFHREAFRRRTQADLDGIPVSIATAEDLVIAKLEWAHAGASLRQIEDVAGILKVRRKSLDLRYIEKWIGELGLTPEWEGARKQAGIG